MQTLDSTLARELALTIARTANFQNATTFLQLAGLTQKILIQKLSARNPDLAETYKNDDEVLKFINDNLILLRTAQDLQQLIDNDHLFIIFKQMQNEYAKYMIVHTVSKFNIKKEDATYKLLNDEEIFNEAFQKCLLNFKLTLSFILHKAPYYIVDLPNSEFIQFIDQILLNKKFIDLIKHAIKQITPEEIEKLTNTEELLKDLSKLKLKKNQSLPINGRFIHHVSHSPDWKALVYINGNVILSESRPPHAQLFKLYFNDLSKNHENDKKPFKSEPISFSSIRKYHGVRGVIKDNVVLLIDAGEFLDEVVNAIYDKLACKIFTFADGFNSLVKKANEILSSDEYSHGERYIPTEQDLKDVQQVPFERLVKPIERQVKNFLYKDVRTLVSSYARHHIHKNKEKTNDDLYTFVMSKISFSSIFWDLIYSYDYGDYFQPIISNEQLHYDFINYMKKHFALYIHLLIDKYKSESILNVEEQSKDKNYNADPYIRTPEQLDLLIDEVHDLIQLDQSFNINYKCRDNAFIFVINRAYTGDSHLNLMKNYLQENKINDPYYFNLENIDKLKLPYAYGHIYHGRALINWYKYCTAEEVKDALLREGKYMVYDYNRKQQTLYRLAKKMD